MTRNRSADESFQALYADHGRAILAYALRRVREPQDAADVVAETFLVAWRRLNDVPPGDEARLWLYGVARRTLANQARSARRRDRLAERLRQELPGAVAAVAAVSAPRTGEALAVLAALGELDEADREVLLLAGWEQLAAAEIAAVLGISAVAARSRLHRARRRLRSRLDDGADPSSARPRPSLREEVR